MRRRRILGWVSAAIVTFLWVIGVPLLQASPVQANTTLVVSAAASLKDVLEEIAKGYRQSKPGIDVRYNFGASGALQEQIENGAPVDVFISAAKKQMDALEQKGMLLPGSRRNLAGNQLVLVAPKSRTGLTSFSKLADPGVKRVAIGEPRSVPAGQYAEQVLQKLGIYESLKPKFVLANNVRQVLAFVESGNADAGIVYLTDAKISDKVKVVAIANERFHSPIVYPMAVLKTSQNASAAKSFVQYLSSNPAKALLRKYGFIVK